MDPGRGNDDVRDALPTYSSMGVIINVLAVVEVAFLAVVLVALDLAVTLRVGVTKAESKDSVTNKGDDSLL